MNLITKRPEGAPDWIPAAVLCWVSDVSPSAKGLNRHIVRYSAETGFLDDYGNWWRYAKPIEAWQPAEGEIVAGWFDVNECIIIGKYCAKFLNIRIYKNTDGYYGPDHVARLVYPDGRIIDCACDVETLKQRVGEWNWL